MMVTGRGGQWGKVKGGSCQAAGMVEADGSGPLAIEVRGLTKTYGPQVVLRNLDLDLPWGEVLADGGFDTGFVSAEIDPAQVTEARAKIPSLDHDRDFE